MAVLTPGNLAPDFTLSDMEGNAFSLRDALKRGPVVVAFFKVSCPTCQYAFPYLERLHKVNSRLNLVAISQNEKKDTAAFTKQFGITFPVLLDDTRTYPVSNDYGLTNVPTIFWIAESGEIDLASVGWARMDIEEVHAKASTSKASGVALKPLFLSGEQVADFRAA
ncbi:MAG: hypothetical protein NVS1B11_09490 [Terriglobales bacterium]